MWAYKIKVKPAASARHLRASPKKTLYNPTNAKGRNANANISPNTN
ncbi:hypothetical protein WEIDD23_00121 [Weissella sp. DD23]|nr:hypothetical protein WEIDD23_00121 [Weissella sp. DD23]